MTLDVCTISTGAWLAFALGFILVGMSVGFLTYIVLRPVDLSPTSWRNPVGSGLIVIAAILTVYFVARSIPNDPCGGAFTPDGPMLPIIAVLCVVIAGLATFWSSIFRWKG